MSEKNSSDDNEDNAHSAAGSYVILYLITATTLALLGLRFVVTAIE